MFGSARIKLTLWYLLIIAIITAVFSMGIYIGFSREFNRAIRIQRFQVEHPGQFSPDRTFNGLLPESRRIDIQLIEESENRIRAIILLVDLGILVASAIAGYFLAGRTLRPIEEMVEDQKRFTADASHELRTPLTAIKSEIEVALRDKKFTINDAKKLLESNLEEVDKLRDLSDYLLTLSKYQTYPTSGVGVNFELLVVSKLVGDAIQKVKPLAGSKNITVKTKIGDINLEGNRRSLTELLIILLDNAIKFSPRNSEVMISAKSDDGQVAIEVKDQGRGIEEKDLPHVFNRFYQVDASREKEDGGFGLGLSIAKRIVELHKGTISVISTSGKGSTFKVLLRKVA